MKPIQDKNIEEMTRKEFEELPLRGWDEDIGKFDSLIILPTKRKHDSGFGAMDFVACKGTLPICRLSGCSDVIHLGGMLNREHLSDYSWSIDCIYKSKLLRIFYHRHELSVGPAISSFEVFAHQRDM
jgi:hypothetical protein